MKRVDKIRELSLIGGEPFMLKELADVVAHISKYSHKYIVFGITTNGTIVPPDKTLKAMKAAKAYCKISNYGDKSYNIKNIVAKLKQYKIPFFSIVPVWRTFMQLVDGSSVTDEQAMEVYNNCTSDCQSLMNGRLYKCTFLASGEVLRVFPANAKTMLIS